MVNGILILNKRGAVLDTIKCENRRRFTHSKCFHKLFISNWMEYFLWIVKSFWGSTISDGDVLMDPWAFADRGGWG